MSNSLFITIPHKSIGFARGESVSIHVQAPSLSKQKVTHRLLVNDSLGATRFSLRDETGKLSAEGLHSFDIPVEGDWPAGNYLVTASVLSGEEETRLIEPESFEVVTPGEQGSDGFPAALRDRLAEPSYRFDPVDNNEVEEGFRTVHKVCQYWRNKDGSWGRRDDPPKVEYRTTGNVCLGYLYAYEATGDEEYKSLAAGGLEYLLAEAEDGAYRWWRPGIEGGVMNDRDPFYDTGWAGLALAEGYRITGEERYLEGVRNSAEWTIKRPFTGNNNCDTFSLWFFSLLYELTEDNQLIESAIHRTEGGIFFAQLPRGGWPGHNFHFGYQSIIANGLASLYVVLPESHPFHNPLRRRLCMSLNFPIFMMAETGKFHTGWEYDRDFRLDENGRPVGNTSWPRAEYMRAIYLVRKQLGVSENLVNALQKAIVDQIATLKDTDPADGSPSLMDIGLLLKWSLET